jgi:hypothetical protein
MLCSIAWWASAPLANLQSFSGAVRASATNSRTPERIVESFQAYMVHSGHSVSRAQFE